ncbi:hypothetical protein J6590_039591 [Homalodisca vitripennis]|nr:hypothetical protein J6590_039591 [Homalodisca vitripennis]
MSEEEAERHPIPSAPTYHHVVRLLSFTTAPKLLSTTNLPITPPNIKSGYTLTIKGNNCDAIRLFRRPWRRATPFNPFLHCAPAPTLLGGHPYQPLAVPRLCSDIPIRTIPTNCFLCRVPAPTSLTWSTLFNRFLRRAFFDAPGGPIILTVCCAAPLLHALG